MSAASVCRMLMHGMVAVESDRSMRITPAWLLQTTAAGGTRCSYGHVLLIEGARAAEDKGDLAGDDVGIVRQEAVAVGIPRRCSRSRHTHIRCRCRRQRGIERYKGLVRIAAVRGIGVEDLRAVAIGEGVAGRAGIIHGGHAEGVLVGAGGAAGGRSSTSSRYRAPVPLTEFSGQLEELPAEMETTVSVSASLSRML